MSKGDLYQVSFGKELAEKSMLVPDIWLETGAGAYIVSIHPKSFTTRND
jgi:hypothetical protein